MSCVLSKNADPSFAHGCTHLLEAYLGISITFLTVAVVSFGMHMICIIFKIPDLHQREEKEIRFKVTPYVEIRSVLLPDMSLRRRKSLAFIALSRCSPDTSRHGRALDLLFNFSGPSSTSIYPSVDTTSIPCSCTTCFFPRCNDDIHFGCSKPFNAAQDAPALHTKLVSGIDNLGLRDPR